MTSPHFPPNDPAPKYRALLEASTTTPAWICKGLFYPPRQDRFTVIFRSVTKKHAKSIHQLEQVTTVMKISRLVFSKIFNDCLRLLLSPGGERRIYLVNLPAPRSPRPSWVHLLPSITQKCASPLGGLFAYLGLPTISRVEIQERVISKFYLRKPPQMD
jgi:hypothetical protein